MSRWMTVVSVAVLFFFTCGAGTADLDDGKYYKIKNANSGKFLAAVDESDQPGAEIVQSAGKKKGDDAHAWKLVKAGDQWKIINRKSGLALEVPKGTKDEGAHIAQGKDRDVKFQKWSIEKISGSYFTIKAPGSGLVLDVWEKSKENGAQVVQWPFNDKGDRMNQKWEFIPAE